MQQKTDVIYRWTDLVKIRLKVDLINLKNRSIFDGTSDRSTISHSSKFSTVNSRCSPPLSDIVDDRFSQSSILPGRGWEYREFTVFLLPTFFFDLSLLDHPRIVPISITLFYLALKVATQMNCSFMQEAYKQCSEQKRVISSEFSVEALQGLLFYIFEYISPPHPLLIFFFFFRICTI